MALDRDSRIIAHLLACAGQCIEQRALAGIGIAGDGDERERVHLAIGVTPIAPAYLRRIATVIRIDQPQPRTAATREEPRFFELVTQVREALAAGGAPLGETQEPALVEEPA